MPRHSGFEIAPLFSHGDIRFTTNDLLKILKEQNPGALPNINRLSNPKASRVPTLGATQIGYNVSLPGDIHVLRVAHNYSSSTTDAQITQLERAHQEVLRLDAIGSREGIPHPVLSHASFLSIADPHARAHTEPHQVTPPQHTIYTVVERIPHGENLRSYLRDPSRQPLLRALGRTQAGYFEQIRADGCALEDTSGHYQYSTAGSLYDITYTLTSDPSTIGEDVAVAQDWVGELLPHREHDMLVGRLATLAALYPVEGEE